ncbi:MAG: hypothetical protein M0R30_09515 [Methanoregula sp.]|jgi:hypothetical protein|uniref:hypothetical protein n=1 Tax=Methanoregula sp. TaxID=2052170 RepID=UPI0025DE98D4|nr:hypothetical protein [Methanoregula sp.]MCK9631869.1 hypothetical protein [Methanoregula sp.]
MNVNKIILVLAAMIVFVVAIIAMLALTDESDHSQQVTTWMQQHAGQEVTAEEYLDITNPGYLESRPKDIREGYSKMKVRVPNLSNPDEGMQFGERSAAIAIAGFREVPEDIQPVSPGNYLGQCTLNESMIAVSNTLAAREISVGTYLETVCPDYFSSFSDTEKTALMKQSLTVSIIPGRGNMSAFVPPQSVAVLQMEYHPDRANLLIYGIFGVVILAAGFLIVRRCRK